MKRHLVGAVLSALIITSVILPVNAEKREIEPPEGFIKASATAYCITGTMANGEKTHEGACASSKDRMGCVLVMYQRLPDDSVGDYIGTYTVEDAGGTKAIKRGDVIDVWKPNLKACQEYMDLLYEDGCKGKVWIQIIEGEG